MFSELDESNTMDGVDVRAQMEEQQQQLRDRQSFPAFGTDNDDLGDFLDDAPMPEDSMHASSHIPTPRTMQSENSAPKPVGEDEEEDTPLEPTLLGNAIDSLMMHWCQLLTNVSVKAPVPPPSTLDHVKEVAEVCSKHFRDASVDVNNEFTRLGVQWEMEECLEHGVVEDANLDEAIERQEQLLDAARDILRNRLETFQSENPKAGTQFNT